MNQRARVLILTVLGPHAHRPDFGVPACKKGRGLRPGNTIRTARQLAALRSFDPCSWAGKRLGLYIRRVRNIIYLIEHIVTQTILDVILRWTARLPFLNMRSVSGPQKLVYQGRPATVF